MLTVVRHGLALAGVTLLLVSGCSDDDGATTTTGAGVPSSSSSSLPAATTTVALSATTSPTTTAPTAPAVAEAGGWRIVITAPTALATIGPALDLCYEATGTAREADIAFEVGLVLAATGTVVSRVRVDATVGRGSARVNLGTPEARRYDMPVQAIVNGQRLDGLAVVIRGVVIGSAPPAGCA